MKAMVYTAYGSPDVLRFTEVEQPAPRENEVLVKILAVSVNSSDWEFLTGRPLYTRMWGLRKPKFTILGSDIAGRVEAVGGKVTRFQQGDEVFGDIFGKRGGFAEYACAPEKSLMIKPAFMTFEEAAAVPQAALIALQGLREQKQVQPGQKVLINGAGGGAGTFAIQIARSFSTEVTGVDSKIKLELMRSIGAEHVIDYQRQDFTLNGLRYDLILDFVASHSIRDYRRSLSPTGRYVMVGGSIPHILQTLFLGTFISLTGQRKMRILGAKPNKDLDYMIQLIESGRVKPVIDRIYPLSETAAALQYLGAGQALGKVVINCSE